MRTQDDSGRNRPVATATVGTFSFFSSVKMTCDSQTGGGRITPDTPPSTRRFTAARSPDADTASHFSNMSCALLRLLSSSAPSRNSLRYAALGLLYKRPMRTFCAPAKLRAAGLGAYRRSLTAARTASRVVSLTFRSPFTTRETVIGDTPAL